MFVKDFLALAEAMKGMDPNTEVMLQSDNGAIELDGEADVHFCVLDAEGDIWLEGDSNQAVGVYREIVLLNLDVPLIGISRK